MPDYAFPGGEGCESMTLSAAAYILSAVIGVVVCGGLLYFLGNRGCQRLTPFFFFTCGN